MSRRNGLVRDLCVVVVAGFAAVSQAAQLQVPAAYPTIQAAIDAAAEGDEVVLAVGTYAGAGNRDLDLRGKAVLVRSSDPSDPAVAAGTVIDCQGSALGPHRGVLLNCNAAGTAAGLDGLTITGAYDPQGAVVCEAYSLAQVRRCVILANTGSGIYCRQAARVIARDCRIEDNVTAGDGGGICLFRECSPLIERCVIRGNHARNGGGIYCYQGWPDVRDSQVSGNYAQAGGGLWWQDSGLSLANCTVAGNSAQAGGGAYGLSVNYADRSAVSNSILWGNMAGDGRQVTLAVLPATTAGDTLAVSYSLVQGGQLGVPAPTGWTVQWDAGNLAGDVDPAFTSANGPDGAWDTWRDNDYHLSAGSPCIDAGDPAGDYAGQADADGQPRVAGVQVDIGAYEALQQAAAPVTGDLNGDGHVDVIDLLTLIAAFGASSGDAAYDAACDFDASGLVDSTDLLTLVGNFGKY